MLKGEEPPRTPENTRSEGGLADSRSRRVAVGVALLGIFAALAWTTMEAGRLRTLVLVVLGGFALRLLLFMHRSRYDGAEGPSA